jgi:hypothetical protein
VLREKFFVSGHEPRLADGGAGLQFGKFGGALFETERAHARADCAAGDDHDFLARGTLLGNLRDQACHLGKVRLLATVGKDARAELDDDAGGGFDGFTMHVAKLGKSASGVEPPSLLEFRL